MLYRGSDSDFRYGPFIEACRGEAHTIAICKTDRIGYVFGAYTDIPWTDDDKEHKGKGNTFVFRFDENFEFIDKYMVNVRIYRYAINRFS